MRKITGEFNNENCIKNVTTMLNIDDLEEMPHWETINNYLEKHNESELESIIQNLVYRLIRIKSFNNSRIRNKYWQIIVDGTGLCNFGKLDEPHWPHCLKKEHKDKQGNIIWTEYYSSNVVEYNQSNFSYPFVFITDLPISNHNYDRLVEDSRRRWKIPIP